MCTLTTFERDLLAHAADLMGALANLRDIFHDIRQVELRYKPRHPSWVVLSVQECLLALQRYLW